MGPKRTVLFAFNTHTRQALPLSIKVVWYSGNFTEKCMRRNSRQAQVVHFGVRITGKMFVMLVKRFNLTLYMKRSINVELPSIYRIGSPLLEGVNK